MFSLKLKKNKSLFFLFLYCWCTYSPIFWPTYCLSTMHVTVPKKSVQHTKMNQRTEENNFMKWEFYKQYVWSNYSNTWPKSPINLRCRRESEKEPALQNSFSLDTDKCMNRMSNTHINTKANHFLYTVSNHFRTLKLLFKSLHV